MRRVVRWLRRWLADNVQVEVADCGTWERVASATASCWRCKKCGDLVLEQYTRSHEEEVHRRRLLAKIELFSDGGAEALAPLHFQLQPAHLHGILKFLEVTMDGTMKQHLLEALETAASKSPRVVQGPWQVE